MASLVEQKIWLLRARLCEYLGTVGEDIEGSEDLGEANEGVAEAVARHGGGESASLRAGPDKQDPDEEVEDIYIFYGFVKVRRNHCHNFSSLRVH